MKRITWLVAALIGSTLFFAGFVGAGFVAVLAVCAWTLIAGVMVE